MGIWLKVRCFLHVQIYLDIFNRNRSEKIETYKLNEKLGNIRYIQKENFFSAWEDSESGYFYVIDIVGEAEDKPSNLSGNRFFGFQWKSGGKNFGYQLAFGFGTDKIAINRIINGAWSDWDYFVPKSYVDDKFLIVDKTLSLPEGITTRGVFETASGFIDTKGRTLTGYYMKTARTGLEIHIQTLTVDSSGKCTLVYDKQSEQAFNIEIIFTFM